MRQTARSDYRSSGSVLVWLPGASALAVALPDFSLHAGPSARRLVHSSGMKPKRAAASAMVPSACLCSHRLPAARVRLPTEVAIHYDHDSTLKTLREIFPLGPLLGIGANPSTNDLSDFFK